MLIMPRHARPVPEACTAYFRDHIDSSLYNEDAQMTRTGMQRAFHYT